MDNNSKRLQSSSGAILILTLWVVALISLMATGLMLRSRLAIREASWTDIELKADSLLASLAALATDNVMADEALDVDSYKEVWARAYQRDSITLMPEYGVQAAGEEFEVSIMPADESGKVNVNLADEDTLVAVLREYGAEGGAPDIAKAIIDWRDEDDIGAAERDYYQSLTPPYAPSDRDMASIDELLFVSGVTPALFFGEDANHNGKLDPAEDDGEVLWPPDNMDGQLQPGLIEAFTVYGEGMVNINTVAPRLLHVLMRRMLNNEPYADTWADALLARRAGQDKIDGTDDDVPFQANDELVTTLAQLLGEETPSQALQLASPFGVTSDAFRFYLTVHFPKKHYGKSADLVLARKDGALKMLEYHDAE